MQIFSVKTKGKHSEPHLSLSTAPSLNTLCSLRFSLSYSAHHRCAWRQSDVFSACCFTCTCQRSWMSHPNWQQMVLFGYERPAPSVQPTLHAIYHHSPSLSSPLRPLRGLWTTILCAIIYLCAGECQLAQPWAFYPGSWRQLVIVQFRQGSMGHFLMMWFSDKPGKSDWLKIVEREEWQKKHTVDTAGGKQRERITQVT